MIPLCPVHLKVIQGVHLFRCYHLMLDEQNIKVAQYLTVLPEKQWFIDKMNRSIMIARELQGRKEEE